MGKKAYRLYNLKPLGQRPREIPSDPNFMTPNVLAYFKLQKGYAELAKGRGIVGDAIYGVTVRPDPDHARSRSGALARRGDRGREGSRGLGC